LPTQYPPLNENKILLVPSFPSNNSMVKAYKENGDLSYNLIVERE